MANQDEYATCAATRATLRIYDLPPDEVTAALGIEPDETQSRGELRHGKPIKLDGWFLSTQQHLPSRDVRLHIGWLLDRLQGREQALEALRAKGARTDISCYWLSASGHGGPTVPPALARRLAELGLECWFDVYFHGALRDTVDPFGRVTATLADVVTPSTGLDLVGFHIDLEEVLRSCKALSSFRFAAATPDRPGLLVEAEVDPSVKSLQELARALQHMWVATTYLRLGATSLTHSPEATTLRFATASPPALFVTGRIRVSGPVQAALAEAYQRHWPLDPEPS